MVSSFIYIVIFVIIIYYVFLMENPQFAATASAMRQVWSGGCRLSCRPSQQSQHSGTSGLSGLAQDTSPCQVGNHHHDCVCDSCPCALIDNFLRTCRPATQLYTDVCHTLSHYLYNFIRSVSEIYEYGARILQCGASCQRQAQVINNKQLTSSGNFSFEKDIGNESSKRYPKFIRSAMNLSKSLSAKKSSISFKEPTRDDASEGKESGETSKDKNIDESKSQESEGSSKDKKVDVSRSQGSKGSSKDKNGDGSKSQGSERSIKDKSVDGSRSQGSTDMLRPSEETLKPADESSSSVPSGYCSKCVEKGNTCINKCPRAKK